MRFDLQYPMLHDFLTTNRALIIDQCRIMAAARSEAKIAVYDSVHGIPVFIDQLIDVLAREQQTQHSAEGTRGRDGAAADKRVGETAMLLGRDLLEQGFTLEQVVRNYGDVCQVVTNQAFETGASIEVDEFRTLNRCLDNAIAGAVTQYTTH